MAIIGVANISKSFGSQKHVLKGISFEVPDGAFFTLLGPSGCGKTTLLRIIAGLEIPDGGRISIRDRDVTRLPPAKRNIAMVFQSYALYPHMTVFKNIATPLRLRNVAEDEIRRRVEETGELLGIAEHMEKRPATLSGGERQRVALARALVRQPDVFLMDEPLSNLDALLREHTRMELKMLFSRLGATVIYVTHDQIEALAMSDIVAILHEGEIQQSGPPLDIYQKPENEFVAGFVGSPRMNFFNVRIRDGDLVFKDDSRVPIPKQFIKSATGFSETIIFGFRPEDAHVEEKGITFSGKIVAVEVLGSKTVVTIEMPAGSARFISDSNIHRIGESISFSISEEKTYLFRHPGGEALRPT